MFLLFQSTDNELRENHLNTLIDHYHHFLIKSLEHYLLPHHEGKFNELTHIFTTANILREFRSKILYGLGISLWLLPAVTFDPNNCPDLNEVSIEGFSSNSHENSITKKHTKVFHERIKDVVSEIYEMGLLKID